MTPFPTLWNQRWYLHPCGVLSLRERSQMPAMIIHFILVIHSQFQDFRPFCLSFPNILCPSISIQKHFRKLATNWFQQGQYNLYILFIKIFLFLHCLNTQSGFIPTTVFLSEQLLKQNIKSFVAVMQSLGKLQHISNNTDTIENRNHLPTIFILSNEHRGKSRVQGRKRSTTH